MGHDDTVGRSKILAGIVIAKGLISEKFNPQTKITDSYRSYRYNKMNHSRISIHMERIVHKLLSAAGG